MTSVASTIAPYLLAIQQNPEPEHYQDNWISQSIEFGSDIEEYEELAYAGAYTNTEQSFIGLLSTQATWEEGVLQKPSESMDHLVSVVKALSNVENLNRRFVSVHSFGGNEWTHPAILEEGNHLLNVIHAYSERLNLLHYYAGQDGIVVNEDSEKGFWAFISSVPSFLAGDLVLLDNGNLRVVWAGEDNESHLGLQFLGNDMVQYVIFKQRPFSRMVSRVAGRDSFTGIRKQIRTFGLEENLEHV